MTHENLKVRPDSYREERPEEKPLDDFDRVTALHNAQGKLFH
ncbi:hypothetical protein [Paraflavitalea soli]|nr:hypothetical protein [Paraflavitalea soli]